MNSIAFDRPVLPTAEVPARTSAAWWRTVWKDWRCVRLIVVAAVMSLAAVQLSLLLTSIRANDLEAKQRYGDWIIALALAGPIFIAVGCCGMLIGHERETGSWAWSSSLPISWRQALGSKMLVTSIASLMTLLGLALVPLIAYSVGRLDRSIHWQESQFALIGIPTTLLIWLEVVALFFLLTLLMRETILAMSIAAVTLTIGQSFFISFLSQYVDLAGRGLVGDDANTVGGLIFVAILAFLAAGFVGMIWAFRWRWTNGLTSQMASPRWLRPWTTDAASSKYAAYPKCRAGEWRTLLGQSLRSGFWLQTIILSCCAVLLLCGWMQKLKYDPGYLTFLNVVAVFALGFQGAATFTSDQSSWRYRYLADRGASPFKVVASRLLLPCVPLLPIIVGIYLIHIRTPLWGIHDSERTFLPVGCFIAAFLIGALGSLCFRQPVIAFTVVFFTLLALIAGLDFPEKFTRRFLQVFSALLGHDRSQLVLQYFWPQQSMNPRLPAWGLLNLWAFGVSAIVLIVLYFTARRWIIFERNIFAIRYFIALPLAMIGSFLALVLGTATFGFLWVPKPAASLPSVDEVRTIIALERVSLPDLPDANELGITTGTNKLYELLNEKSLLIKTEYPHLRSLGLSTIDPSERPIYEKDQKEKERAKQHQSVKNEDVADEDVAGDDDSDAKEAANPPLDYQKVFASVPQELAMIEEKLKGRQVTNQNVTLCQTRLRWLVIRTAVIAGLAAKQGDYELSARAFRLNKMLLAFGGQVSYRAIYSGRFSTWLVWQQLSDAEIEGLGGPEAVENMLPNESSMKKISRQASRLGIVLWAPWRQAEVRNAGIYDMLYDPDQSDYILPQLKEENRPLWSNYPPLIWMSERVLINNNDQFFSESSTKIDGIRSAFLERLSRLHMESEQ